MHYRAEKILEHLLSGHPLTLKIILEIKSMGLEATIIGGLLSQNASLKTQLAAAQVPAANIKDPADLAAEQTALTELSLDASGNSIPVAAPAAS